MAAPSSRGAEGVSKGYPEAYQKAMESVLRAFLARDFKLTLARLAEADKIIPDTPMALNTRGAIAIEQKRYAEGQKFCEEALKKDPAFFPAQFNLAEIPFQKKDYAGARKIFRHLLGEEKRADTIELLQYRVFITYVLEKNDDAALEELDRMKFPSVTGAYYYAHAAWEFAHHNQTEALSWVYSGDWVFSRAKNGYFADVMYDLGWLKRPEERAAQPPAGEKAPAVETPPAGEKPPEQSIPEPAIK